MLNQAFVISLLRAHYAILYNNFATGSNFYAL